MLKIAREEGIDPGTVSSWLKKLGVSVRPGHHFVRQLPLRIDAVLVEQLDKGPGAALELVKERIWGIQASEDGELQLRKYCKYLGMHEDGLGLGEIAQTLGLHRSTVAAWRKGTDRPYLVKALAALCQPPRQGFLKLPLSVSSGGNELGPWVEVPSVVNYNGILEVLAQVNPSESAYIRGASFGMDRGRVDSMRAELIAYLLGFMLGDASKLGGSGSRFRSLNLDLQLSTKQPSNERMGEFVCLCANSLGFQMDRRTNKKPSGATRYGKHPSEAYRWQSERSPLLSWMFLACLGLRPEENTSHHPVKMNWIISAPHRFRLRFVQAIADSDASVKPSEIVITSVPNAEFITDLLRSLGSLSAHTVSEGGALLRSMINRREASRLPLFNEVVHGYRYDQMMQPSRRPSKYGSIGDEG